MSAMELETNINTLAVARPSWRGVLLPQAQQALRDKEVERRCALGMGYDASRSRLVNISLLL
jgi:hypothetical protein